VEAGLRARLGEVVTSYGRDDVLASSLGMTALWFLRAVAHPNDAIVRRQFVSRALGDAAAIPPTLDGAIKLIADSGTGVIADTAKASLDRKFDGSLVPRLLEQLESESAKAELTAFAATAKAVYEALRPRPCSIVSGLASDLLRSHAELLTENVVLRQ